MDLKVIEWPPASNYYSLPWQWWNAILFLSSACQKPGSTTKMLRRAKADKRGLEESHVCVRKTRSVPPKWWQNQASVFVLWQLFCSNGDGIDGQGYGGEVTTRSNGSFGVQDTPNSILLNNAAATIRRGKDKTIYLHIGVTNSKPINMSLSRPTPCHIISKSGRLAWLIEQLVQHDWLF